MPSRVTLGKKPTSKAIKNYVIALSNPPRAVPALPLSPGALSGRQLQVLLVLRASRMPRKGCLLPPLPCSGGGAAMGVRSVKQDKRRRSMLFLDVDVGSCVFPQISFQKDSWFIVSTSLRGGVLPSTTRLLPRLKDFSSKKLERANMNLSREEVLRATTRESPRLSIWPRPPAPWLFLALGP